LGIIEEGVIALPTVYHASPRGPTPYRKGRGKEVTVIAIGRDLILIESAYHRDTLVVLIPIEHLLAKREERLRGHIIVLEHHALVYHRESPLL
jgi:hypothetical protein